MSRKHKPRFCYFYSLGLLVQLGKSVAYEKQFESQTSQDTLLVDIKAIILVYLSADMK